MRLKQCPLQLFVLGGFCRVHRLEGTGVIAAVVHGGGKCARCGIKILHLLGCYFVLAQVLGKLDGIVKIAARMTAHKIGYGVLLKAHSAVYVKKLVDKAAVNVEMGFAHIPQHAGRHMLGSNTQLTADMIPDQRLKKVVIFVAHQIIVTDARADKDFFDTLELTQLVEQAEIIAVIGVKIGAGCGVQTGAVGAGALLELFFAGRLAEVCRRAAYVVDIAFEVGEGYHALGFFYDAFMAAAGDHSALMQSEGAEGAAAKAAAVVGDRKPDLLDSGHAAQRDIVGVDIVGIGQLVDRVKLAGIKGHLGRILDQIALTAFLHQSFAAYGVLLVLFDIGCAGVFFLVSDAVFIRGQHNSALKIAVGGLGHIAGAADIGDIADFFAFFQPFCNFADGALTHTVDKQVCAAIFQYASAHVVVPIVIVDKSTQGAFDTADYQGDIGECSAGKIAVDVDRTVGAVADFAAGGVGILGAAAACHGVVCHHGVHVARGYEHAVTGSAKAQQAVNIVPVGLGAYGDLEAVFFQYAGDYCRAE